MVIKVKNNLVEKRTPATKYVRVSDSAKKYINKIARENGARECDVVDALIKFREDYKSTITVK